MFADQQPERSDGSGVMVIISITVGALLVIGLPLILLGKVAWLESITPKQWAIGIHWVGFAMLTSWAASQRGRSSVRWFLVGLALGPLAILGPALAPSLTASDR